MRSCRRTWVWGGDKRRRVCAGGMCETEAPLVDRGGASSKKSKQKKAKKDTKKSRVRDLGLACAGTWSALSTRAGIQTDPGRLPLSLSLCLSSPITVAPYRRGRRKSVTWHAASLLAASSSSA
jgi:hypothetical protein